MSAENIGVQGVAWDLSSEYESADCPAIDSDLSAASELMDQMKQHNLVLLPLLERAEGLGVEEATGGIEAAREIHRISEEVRSLIGNPDSYADCRMSVDSQDEAAQVLSGQLQSYQKRFSELSQPLSQFLDLVSAEIIEVYLDHELTKSTRFVVEHARKRRDFNLSLAEETLVSGLAQDGIHAWGRLYDQLAGTLTCDVLVGNESQSMGLAETSGLLQKPDDGTRENAWRAINEAWGEQVESCAAAINSIAGWRLELGRRRSGKSPVHFLDSPAHMNRISKTTLDVVLSVAEESMPLAQRAALLQAKAYGKERYGPWDQRSPAPTLGDDDRPIPYAEALELIANAYRSIDPTMGEFVEMMAERKWIEGTVGSRKRPGAYCTAFPKSRTPRVYMTYTGGTSDVITLAHELGHAFHSWTMRDLPDSQQSYGMSLAETASTFGETIVRDALLERAETPSEELAIAWEETGALISFVLNIPTRFEFEKNFYQAREERPLRPDELKELMSQAWQKWYGESLSEPDPLFWANKLHFFISELSFYNFPYLFGYLFSLGVYAKRLSFGDEFFPRYEGLLRDTGRMTAEDLAAKHLDVDISQADFWRDTVAMLQPRVDHFEKLVNDVTG